MTIADWAPPIVPHSLYATYHKVHAVSDTLGHSVDAWHKLDTSRLNTNTDEPQRTIPDTRVRHPLGGNGEEVSRSDLEPEFASKRKFEKSGFLNPLANDRPNMRLTFFGC